MRTLLLVPAFSLLTACGGAFSDDAPTDAGLLGDTAAPPPSDAGVASDAPGDTRPPPPSSIASTQTVTFVITNGASEERWIVTRGVFCTSFAVSGLSLAMGFTCECECPNPGSARVDAYRRLKPGESWEVTWDARALVTYPETIDCAARGWMGAPPQTVTRGVLRPVAPGSYAATFPYESTLPSRCTASGDEATCAWTYGGYPGSLPSAIAAVCASAKSASAKFSLPAAGDIKVPVTLE